MPLTMRPLWQFGSICGTPHTDRPADTGGRDDETRDDDGTCGTGAGVRGGVVVADVVVVAVEVVVVVVVVVVVDDEVVAAGVVARPDILTQGLVGRNR